MSVQMISVPRRWNAIQHRVLILVEKMIGEEMLNDLYEQAIDEEDEVSE
jgi:hypothetical protein